MAEAPGQQSQQATHPEEKATVSRSLRAGRNIVRDPAGVASFGGNPGLHAVVGSRYPGRYAASHETSTHYKWLLYRSYSPRFTVWLHDYKTDETRGPGYAQVPHNHRYDLCSMVLAGGYDSLQYDVGADVAMTDRRSFAPGDVLSQPTES